MFLQGTNVTMTYDNNSKVVISGTCLSPPYNIGSIVSGLTVLPIEIRANASYVRSSAGTYSSITMTGGQTLELQGYYTVTINKLNTSGATLANPAYIKGYGGPATLVKNGGYLNFVGTSLSNITASGSAKFLAFESTNAGSVTGITIKPTKKPVSESTLLIF